MRVCCILLIAFFLFSGCSQGADARAERGTRGRQAAVSRQLTDARATVEARYAAHWHTDQGFSRDTLRARRAWFTPALYQLLRADLSGEEIGALDHDPFTDAQDTAERYAIEAPRASGDTVYVPVVVHFATASEPPHRITLAMVASGARWQIADFVDQNGSLAALLRDASPVQAAHATPDSAGP